MHLTAQVSDNDCLDVPLRCRLIRQSPDATVHTVVQ